MKYNKLFNQEPWGKCYNIIAVDGLSIVRVYVYDEEKESAYFNGLLVAKSKRKNGRGNEILKEAEEFAKKKFPNVKVKSTLENIHQCFMFSKRH